MESAVSKITKHIILGGRGCRGGAEMCAAPCAQEASQPVRVVWILENAFSENDGTCWIKWWWIQIVCQKIGTQTAQKRKNLEMRTWELVGTQLPRWHLAATSRWPASYVCVIGCRALLYICLYMHFHQSCNCVRSWYSSITKLTILKASGVNETTNRFRNECVKEV